MDALGENTFEHCLYTLLTHTLDLSEFESRYKKTIEPAFGNITSNKGIHKLMLRGKAKLSCQYPKRFMQNIEKLQMYGNVDLYAIEIK